MHDESHRTVVFRQSKRNDPMESLPLKENEQDDAVGKSSSLSDRPRGRNIWLLIWTIPVLVVLFWLPIQEEIELEGSKRAKLEERVSVLAKQPVDFVVHAATHQRWSYQGRKPFKPVTSGSGIISSSQAPCVRIFGMNETLNLDPNARKSLPRIKHIRIVGERNSGARVLHTDLQKSLRNVTIESGVTRWGYWFQDPQMLGSFEHKPEETLVIHVVLDPYEWFARMQVNPIHAPHHRKPELYNSNWTSQTFFKRPWTIPRPEWDVTRPPQGHCQYRFPFDAVVPCMAGKNTGAKANKNYPVYELHPVKLTPFPTIVHLRTAKLRNFLNITSWMPHVIHVRARDVAGLNGLNAFVSALLDRYRLSIACEVHKRDPVKIGSPTHAQSLEQVYSWSENPPEPLTDWQTKFITCNLDWDVEAQVGFFPREELESACPHGFVGHGSKAGQNQEAKPEDKSILFRFMDGISNLGRRRIKQDAPTSARKSSTAKTQAGSRKSVSEGK